MKKKQKQTILAKVQVASKEVSEAAADLDKLLGEIKANLRAEKTTISKAVATAFSRLKSARVALADIEVLVAKEKDE